jgi:hypothetical protein
MATKKQPDEVRPTYTAYADFTLDGVLTQEGDAFTPPPDWKIDQPMQELHETTHRRGTCFVYEFDTTRRDENRKVIKDTHTIILPMQ